MKIRDDIIEDINTILDNTWTQKQLACGKWIEVNKFWTKQDVAIIMTRYRAAGWHITLEVEISPGLTRQYLSFIHPKFVDLKTHKY